jgi:hypothetical protein
MIQTSLAELLRIARSAQMIIDSVEQIISNNRTLNSMVVELMDVLSIKADQIRIFSPY